MVATHGQPQQWGKIPTQSTITYAFATSKGSRAKQDVGFNGLTDEEEQQFASYQNFLTAARANTNQAVSTLYGQTLPMMTTTTSVVLIGMQRRLLS